MLMLLVVSNLMGERWHVSRTLINLCDLIVTEFDIRLVLDGMQKEQQSLERLMESKSTEQALEALDDLWNADCAEDLFIEFLQIALEALSAVTVQLVDRDNSSLRDISEEACFLLFKIQEQLDSLILLRTRCLREIAQESNPRDSPGAQKLVEFIAALNSELRERVCLTWAFFEELLQAARQLARDRSAHPFNERFRSAITEFSGAMADRERSTRKCLEADQLPL